MPVPPPGPALAFREWTVALVRELRFYVPDVQVDVRARDRVVWTVGDVWVSCVNAAGVYSITFGATGASAPGPLSDAGRHDAYMARTLAKAVAEHFDPRLAPVDPRRGVEPV